MQLMNFGAIIERSLKLVRTHTVLWKLGLLALFTEGITSGIVSGPPFPMPPSEEDKSVDQFVDQISIWASVNQELLYVVGGLLIVVVILIWYLSLRAKAGLILTIVDLEAGKPAPRFLEAYRLGDASAWRLMGLYLMFGLIITAILALPFALLTPIADRVTDAALIGFFLFSLPVIVLIAAYVSFITKMAERAVVLSGARIWAALGTAHRILFGRLGHSAVALLIDLGLTVLFMMLLVAIIIVAVGLAALVGLALHAILPQAIMVAVIGATALLFLAGFFLLTGWFVAFTISYWTLTYQALNYLGFKKGDKK